MVRSVADILAEWREKAARWEKFEKASQLGDHHLSVIVDARDIKAVLEYLQTQETMANK